MEASQSPGMSHFPVLEYVVFVLALAALAEIRRLQFGLEAVPALIHRLHHDIRVEGPKQVVDDRLTDRGSPLFAGLFETYRSCIDCIQC